MELIKATEKDLPELYNLYRRTAELTKGSSSCASACLSAYTLLSYRTCASS